MGLDDIKNPKHGLRKAELTSLQKAYKQGIDTKIDHQHFYHFNKRFMEENAKALAEAKEENERINKKRTGIHLAKLRHRGIIK